MATGRSPFVLLSAVALAAAIVAWQSARPSAHVPISTSVTWNRDVIGIVERRCVACHRDNGPAPMALTSYDIARPWARAIREEVLERRMPPAGLRSGTGLYENARALSLAEVEMLVSWADGGAPRGTGDEPAPTPADHTHWTANVQGVAVPGNAETLQRTIKVPAAKGWLEEWTIDPGDWPALSAVLRLNNRDIVGDWTAGDPPVRYPDGAGLQIPAADTLTIELTLAHPLPQDAAALPTFRARYATGALRSVTRRTFDRALDPTAPGERLLALQLRLAQPDASADVFLTRKSGEEEFLMAIAPPGAADSISYRLREPLTLQQGDILQVQSTSAFSLNVESLTQEARKSSSRGRR